MSTAVDTDRTDTLGEAETAAGLVDGEPATDVNGALVDETHEIVSLIEVWLVLLYVLKITPSWRVRKSFLKLFRK